MAAEAGGTVAVVLAHYAAQDSGNWQHYAACIDPGGRLVEAHSSLEPALTGQAALVEAARAFHAAHTDVHVRLTSLVAQGGRVTVELNRRAQRRETSQWEQEQLAEVFEVAGGRIMEVRRYAPGPRPIDPRQRQPGTAALAGDGRGWLRKGGAAESHWAAVQAVERRFQAFDSGSSEAFAGCFTADCVVLAAAEALHPVWMGRGHAAHYHRHFFTRHQWSRSQPTATTAQGNRVAVEYHWHVREQGGRERHQHRLEVFTVTSGEIATCHAYSKGWAEVR